MLHNDVVVTSVGMVTPLGLTSRQSADGWRQGLPANREPLAALAGTPLEGFEVGTLPGFDPALRVGNRRMLKFMSFAAMLGAAAAREAVETAGVRRRFAPHRVGLFAGTGLAAANIDEVRPIIERSIEDGQFSCRLLGTQGLSSTNPLLSFRILANMPACIISILEGIQGPNLIFTPWEGQSSAALQEAWQAVASGEVDCALTGGSDQPAHPATIVYLRRMGMLGPDDYPSPGAGYLVLERAQTARRDGVAVLARIHSVEVHTLGEEASAAGSDPLAGRMGRTFAAAPGILLGLASLGIEVPTTMYGADAQLLRAEIEVEGKS
jgi:3-oxoacyl-(acyl-carrier-protein) synthase